jgi:hypothetical protein
MKSHKIRRLEFISDKIDAGDCKRKVVRIRFGHPTKKQAWLELSMGGGHGRTLSSMGGGRGGSSERKRGGRGGERGRARDCGEEEGREGRKQGAVARGGRGLLLGSVPAALREEESGKGKRKKKKKGRKKWEIFPNFEIFGKRYFIKLVKNK